jgi:hypothetical protein
MISKVEERLRELRRLTKQFDERMKLARASELARDGRLLEAEGILCQGKGLPQSVEELDMLARIYVLQGRYGEAKRRWRDAAKLDESHAHSECIEVLDQWLEHRHKVLLKWVKLAGYIILAIVVMTVLLKLRFWPN